MGERERQRGGRAWGHPLFSRMRRFGVMGEGGRRRGGCQTEGHQRLSSGRRTWVVGKGGVRREGWRGTPSLIGREVLPMVVWTLRIPCDGDRSVARPLALACAVWKTPSGFRRRTFFRLWGDTPEGFDGHGGVLVCWKFGAEFVRPRDTNGFRARGVFRLWGEKEFGAGVDVHRHAHPDWTRKSSDGWMNVADSL